MQITIRSCRPDDARDITRIYNTYVTDTCITFETLPVSTQDMATRMAEGAAAPLPWLVAEAAQGMLGYAFASPWKGRCAYRHSVESTVYLDPAHTGKGVGRPLYSSLLKAVRALGMRTVIGGIALPNAASVALHERLGFAKVGHFQQVGHKHGRWIDVGYWQLLL